MVIPISCSPLAYDAAEAEADRLNRCCMGVCDPVRPMRRTELPTGWRVSMRVRADRESPGTPRPLGEECH